MNLSRRTLLASLAAAPAMTSYSHPAAANGLALGELARREKRYFGAAVRIDQIAAEPTLREAVLRDCGVVTPEIHLKWDALQPAPGRWTFGPADGLAAFAKSHGLGLRGHTLLWEQSTPAWAKAAMAEKGWPVVADHFRTVLSRYGQASEWDVVNEPVGDDGALRPNSFHAAFGDDYVKRALFEARGHAPAARLFINDYGFDYDNATEAKRRVGLLKLAERLKAGGVPLDGVGIQAHLDLAKGPLKPAIVRKFLQDIADLGLDIVITEMDVKERNLRGPTARRDAEVATEAAAYLEVALDQPAVKGVVTWGLSDKHSWLNPAAGQMNRGLPYDADFAPKPMYRALQAAFAGGSDHQA